MTPPRKKLPPALTTANDAYQALEVQIEDVIRTMAKWPEVRDTVLIWINSITTTNVGWGEYGLAQQIADRWARHQRRSVS